MESGARGVTVNSSGASRVRPKVRSSSLPHAVRLSRAATARMGNGRMAASYARGASGGKSVCVSPGTQLRGRLGGRRLRGWFWRPQTVQQQDGDADNNGRVADVEHERERIERAPVQVQEIHHHAEAEAVRYVAQRTAGNGADAGRHQRTFRPPQPG